MSAIGEPDRANRNVWPIFISYRRGLLTERIARELKAGLEKCNIEALTGQVFTLDVFVDSQEEHQPNFQSNLVPHLRQSRALIVLVDAGATSRRGPKEIDYLYEELCWWATKRARTPPIILQLDAGSGAKFVAYKDFAPWQKVSRKDCFWELWESSSDFGMREKSNLFDWLARSIRDYGHARHLEEVSRLRKRAIIAWSFAIATAIAFLFAGINWRQASQAKDDANEKRIQAENAREQEYLAKLKERGTLASSYVQTADHFISSGNSDLALAYIAQAINLTPDDGSIREHFRWLLCDCSWPLRLSQDVDLRLAGPHKDQLFSYSASGCTVCAVYGKTARFILLGGHAPSNSLTLPDNSSRHVFYDNAMPFPQGASALFNVITDDVGVLVCEDGNNLAAQFYDRVGLDWVPKEKVRLPFAKDAKTPVYLPSRDGSVFCLSAIRKSTHGEETGPRQFVALNTHSRTIVGKMVSTQGPADSVSMLPLGPSLIFCRREPPIVARGNFANGQLTKLWEPPNQESKRPANDEENSIKSWAGLEMFDVSSDMTRLLGAVEHGLIVADLTGKSEHVFVPWSEMPFLKGVLVKGQFVDGNRLVMLSEQTSTGEFAAGMAKKAVTERPPTAEENSLIWFYDLEAHQKVSEPIRSFNPKLSMYSNTGDRGMFYAQAFAAPNGEVTVLSIIEPHASLWKLDGGRPEPLPIEQLAIVPRPNSSQEKRSVVGYASDGSALLCKVESEKVSRLDTYRLADRKVTASVEIQSDDKLQSAKLLQQNRIRLIYDRKPDGFKIVVPNADDVSAINAEIPSATEIVDESIAGDCYFGLYSSRKSEGWDMTGLLEAMPTTAESIFGEKAVYEIGVWDIRSGRRIFSKSFSAYEHTEMAVDPTGNGFALLSYRKATDSFFTAEATVERYVRSNDGFNLLFTCNTVNAIDFIQFSPSSRRLFLGSANGDLLEFDSAGKFSKRLTGLSDTPDPIVFSADERLLACGFGDCVQVFDGTTFRALGSPVQHDAPVQQIAFIAHGQALAVRCQYKGYSNAIWFWDFRRSLALGKIGLGGWGGTMAWDENAQRLFYRVGKGSFQLLSYDLISGTPAEVSSLATQLCSYQLNNLGMLEHQADTWNPQHIVTPAGDGFNRWTEWRFKARNQRTVLYGFDDDGLAVKTKRASWLDNLVDLSIERPEN